jgi:hypothetical protein
MSKYYPLERHLTGANRAQPVHMTFAQIESLIGTSLPDSARKHRAFWGNNSKGHVHAAAWLDAKWNVDAVDLSRSTVRFVSL